MTLLPVVWLGGKGLLLGLLTTGSSVALAAPTVFTALVRLLRSFYLASRGALHYLLRRMASAKHGSSCSSSSSKTA